MVDTHVRKRRVGGAGAASFNVLPEWMGSTSRPGDREDCSHLEGATVQMLQRTALGSVHWDVGQGTRGAASPSGSPCGCSGE